MSLRINLEDSFTTFKSRTMENKLGISGGYSPSIQEPRAPREGGFHHAATAPMATATCDQSSRGRATFPVTSHAGSSQSRTAYENLVTSRLPSQSDDVITPRTWSDMIASDISPSDTDHIRDRTNSHENNVNTNSQQTDKLEVNNNNNNSVRKQLYAEDVTFQVFDSDGGPASPIFRNHGSHDLSDDLITPRAWKEMVAEVTGSSYQQTVTSKKDLKAHTSAATELPDPLAESIQFAWPTESPRGEPKATHVDPTLGNRSETGNRPETEIRPKTETSKPPSAIDRISQNLQMLRKELILMRQADQQIFRTLLRNYETIGEMFDHVTVTMVTPSPNSCSPYPVTPRSQPCSPEKTKSYAASSGDADLLHIVRDALAQRGSLNIPEIVDRLSPIRRRRSSEPSPMEYDDLPPDFGLDEGDEDIEDLLSFSCPVFKEPKAPIRNKNS